MTEVIDREYYDGLLSQVVREREYYNGMHQAAVMEIDRLRKVLERIAQGGNVVSTSLPHHPVICRETMALIAVEALSSAEK